MSTPTELTPGIFRFNNERFYGSKVGCYLIDEPAQVVLIEVPAFNEGNVRFVQGFKKPIVCIATHGPTIIADAARWQKELSVKILLHKLDINDPWLAGTPDQLLETDETQIGRLRVIHTPGHTPGSVCIFDEHRKVLFTGDSVAGTERGDVRPFKRGDSHDSDSKLRYESVSAISRLEFDAILPFHYSPLLRDAGAKLRNYLTMRE